MQAFDQHLNMVLGDVEESVTTREIDEETEEEIVKVKLKSADSWGSSLITLLLSSCRHLNEVLRCCSSGAT
jgi:hypothetical protein